MLLRDVVDRREEDFGDLVWKTAFKETGVWVGVWVLRGKYREADVVSRALYNVSRALKLRKIRVD